MPLVVVAVLPATLVTREVAQVPQEASGPQEATSELPFVPEAALAWPWASLSWAGAQDG